MKRTVSWLTKLFVSSVVAMALVIALGVQQVQAAVDTLTSPDQNSSAYEIIRKNEDVKLTANGGIYSMTITCPTGKKVVGGGWGNNSWTNLSTNVDTVISMPSPNTSTFNTSSTEWTIGWINRANFDESLNLAGYAICIIAPK